jgi:hypothetical protein
MDWETHFGKLQFDQFALVSNLSTEPNPTKPNHPHSITGTTPSPSPLIKPNGPPSRANGLPFSPPNATTGTKPLAASVPHGPAIPNCLLSPRSTASSRRTKQRRKENWG